MAVDKFGNELRVGDKAINMNKTEVYTIYAVKDDYVQVYSHGGVIHASQLKKVEL